MSEVEDAFKSIGAVKDPKKEAADNEKLATDIENKDGEKE